MLFRSQTAINALTPTTGQKVYNTTTNQLQYYNGTKWMPCSQKSTVAIDCSSNPNYPAALVGEQYIVSVAGKIGGASGLSVYVGDIVYCISNNAGGTQGSVGSSWAINGSRDADDSPVYYASTTIETADVLTLNATPVPIISAAGSGKAIIPTLILVTMDFNSAAYTTHTSMRLQISDNADLEIFDLSKSNNWRQVTPFEIGHDLIENEAVYVTVDTGNPSAGNSDVKVKIWYKIVTL